MNPGESSEIDRNYEAFVQRLPEIIPAHRGQYALLHNRKIVQYFSDALAAMRHGFATFGEGCYSVQEVTAERDSLGFYSYAGGSGNA